jgi:very-short-patch-repair endonuclease
MSRAARTQPEAERGRGIRRVFELERGPGITRSKAERKLVALLRAAALPAPELNARVKRDEVDFLWRKHRVAVEVDGYAYHADRRAFERDRERDGVLLADGYAVLRITWRQLITRHEAVIAKIAAALAVRGTLVG